MRLYKNSANIIKRITALMICLIMAAAFLLPSSVYAQGAGKTVRVGWYESPFNTSDQFGRRSGYAYDYQRKIAAYTGWKYEYVEGSWPDLLQMLIDGEIDLMSDVSYTPERSQMMLFSALPMGAEEYYIFISPNNTEINKDDYSTFNGKKVGVNKGSVQAGFFLEWEEANGVRAELIEMTEDLDESIEMLNRGEIDMYIVLDGYLDPRQAVPVCNVGASDFYFAVNKTRPDLLADLNAAMNRIQEEDHNYNQLLYDKYLKAFGSNYYLNTEEKHWLSSHGPIRIGYLNDYLPFSAADEETGELTGALKDYLDYASTGFINAELSFEPVEYPSASAAFDALRNGEIDCMFPSDLSTYDGEKLNLIMTPSVMTSEIYAIIRKADQNSFFQKESVKVAATEDDTNHDTVLMDNFPGWQHEEYQDTEACLKAVAEGQADCVLVSNYQLNKYGKLCDRLNLGALATGKNLVHRIAMRESDTDLYSILTRASDIVNDTNINAALSYYTAEESRTTLIDFIKDNPALDFAVIIVVIALLSVIIAQQRIIRARKKVNELSKQVFTDALTSVKNKAAFNECVRELQEKINKKEELEMAIAVLDCDDLKGINDIYGHDKGDIYIKAASRMICSIYKSSPVFRTGGDEFAVVLQNQDYLNRDKLRDTFIKSSEVINASAENEWDKVRVAIGMADYDPGTDRGVDDVIRRADKAMYEDKRARKELK